MLQTPDKSNFPWAVEFYWTWSVVSPLTLHPLKVLYASVPERNHSHGSGCESCVLCELPLLKCWGREDKAEAVTWAWKADKWKSSNKELCEEEGCTAASSSRRGHGKRHEEGREWAVSKMTREPIDQGNHLEWRKKGRPDFWSLWFVSHCVEQILTSFFPYSVQ